MGIGQALMEKTHAWSREVGIRTVELIVWEFNDGARHFYENLGYKTAKRRMWLDLEEGG
jgi:ribosomal protein S18 acetylase RimI-like enzyme